MKRTSKGASAPVSPAIFKLAPVTQIRESVSSLSEESRACIDSLEYLLGMARRGKLIGLMYTGVLLDPDESRDSVVSDIVGAAKTHALSMLGMLAVLERDLLSEADKQ